MSILINNQIKRRSYATAVKLPLMLFYLMDRLPTDLVRYIQTFIPDFNILIENHKYSVRRLLISIHPELYFTHSVLNQSDSVLNQSPNIKLSNKTIDFIVRNYNGRRYLIKPSKTTISDINQDSRPDIKQNKYSLLYESDNDQQKIDHFLKNYNTKSSKSKVKFNRKLTKTEYKLSNLDKNSKTAKYLHMKTQIKNAALIKKKNHSKLININRFEKFKQINPTPDEINFYDYDYDYDFYDYDDDDYYYDDDDYDYYDDHHDDDDDYDDYDDYYDDW